MIPSFADGDFSRLSARRPEGETCGGCGVAGAAAQRCVARSCVTQRTGCAAGVDLESRGVCLSGASAVPRVCAASDLAAALPTRRALFDGVGADQSWVVPAGVTEVVVKLWGAGGGNTMYATAGGAGGAGAFVRARITVTRLTNRPRVQDHLRLKLNRGIRLGR